MKQFLLPIVLTLMTGSAAMANSITQPHCGEGSQCQAAMETPAQPNPAVQSAQDAGPAWELDPVSPIPGTVAVCTATEGCDPVIRTPVIVENDCALSQVESLVGHPIEITEEYHLSPRVFSAEDMAATMDYWPWRFNVLVDADGMITQAFCG
ncbi:hypothetical protein [Nioella aestuarii]|uniref:hypothetical protein n=1 Tax=Nioella aestuarii TaxID=1662864 RepID=UPI003D7FA245